MATAVTMPRLGLSMVEGTVVEWYLPPGAPVARGQVVLTVESEKAQVEVEAFADGMLAAVYVEAGVTVPVGALLGAVAAPDEAFDAAAFAASFVAEVPGAPATGGGVGAAAGVAPPVPGVREEPAAAPAARALAKRLGVALGDITGTGPGGRITVADVERAAAPAGPAGLSYTTAGSGPALVFVAGYGVDTTAWRRQLDALAARFTVVAYDHRGVGRSRPAADGLSLAELAADAHALVVALGLAPAVVVGASMGAAVALELALAHPEAVRGLVLVTPIVARDARFEAVLQAWREHDAPQAEGRIRAMLPWLLGRELLASAGRREAAAAALRAMAARTPPETLRRHADALLAWLGTRTQDLPRIASPALVVAGADDVLTPAHARAIAGALPHARLEVLDGAGHAVMIERAEALNGLVTEFARGLRE
jgi:pimeloyl-ACP methyl ester carboxylesterase